MANEKNLKPFNSETAREMGRKGGKASGESRRRKANIRKVMNDLLANGTIRMNGEEVPYEVAICYAMLRETLGGHNNVSAFRAILAAAGQDEKSELDVKEQKARIKATEAATEATRKKLFGDDAQDDLNDGFLEALRGSATEDWEDEED